ncbi:cell division protein ZapA [Clostridium sp. CAG:964]|nr:cell division protein ZapA [Clostridium sp. CAG:964]
MGEEEKKNKVRLKICGSQFLITADESRQYIQKIAGIVDKRIKQLSDSDQKLSVQMATIVAALNYCDQLEKEKVITRELIKKTDDCESIARDATMQLNKLLVENQQLKEEKAGLHRVIAELKAGTYVEEASKPKTDTAVADSHTKTAPTSTKAVPTRLNSVTEQKASGVQDRLFTRDEFADVVTDEELMNLLNEES